MISWSLEWATVKVLWRRDVLRFWRQPSRIVGALGQPIIFWLVIGSGMATTFQLKDAKIGYMEYFYPGVVVMVLLFSSIFASVSVIEDRHQGFLQAVMAGPGSRAAMVLGKCLGSSSVALIQVGVFMALAPLAGFVFSDVQWLSMFAILIFSSLGLTALGFCMAWYLDSVQAYHAIQMTLLMPLWVVSGAMFPVNDGHLAFRILEPLNPLAYAVSGTRHAFYGGQAPGDLTITSSLGLEIGCLALVCTFAFAAAVWVCERRR